MKTLAIDRKWSLPALAAIVIAAFALAFTAQPASAATVQAHVKQASIADHAGDCGTGTITGYHFIITQIGSAAPGSISVSLSDGTTVDVPLSKMSGPTAHYDLMGLAPGVTVTDAVADVPDTWTGQFVVSNVFCDTTTTTTTPTSSTTSGPSPTQTS
jgi:hypothetical protein